MWHLRFICLCQVKISRTTWAGTHFFLNLTCLIQVLNKPNRPIGLNYFRLDLFHYIGFLFTTGLRLKVQFIVYFTIQTQELKAYWKLMMASEYISLSPANTGTNMPISLRGDWQLSPTNGTHRPGQGAVGTVYLALNQPCEFLIFFQRAPGKKSSGFRTSNPPWINRPTMWPLRSPDTSPEFQSL